MFIFLTLEFHHILQTVHHINNKSVTKVLINGVAHFHTISLSWNVDCNEWQAEIKAERWTWVPAVCRWGNLCEIALPWSVSWRRLLVRVKAMSGGIQSCLNHVFSFLNLKQSFLIMSGYCSAIMVSSGWTNESTPRLMPHKNVFTWNWWLFSAVLFIQHTIVMNMCFICEPFVMHCFRILS